MHDHYYAHGLFRTMGRKARHIVAGTVNGLSGLLLSPNEKWRLIVN
jgi:hypothetical protein